MGAGGSKAAQSTVRKFPSRAPGSVPPKISKPDSVPPRRTPPAPPPERQRAAPQASFSKNEAIKQDSVNPDRPPEFLSADFADRLKQMGVAQPNPTYSPSSIAQPLIDASGISQSMSGPLFPSSRNNATLGVLEARRQIEQQAKEELENFGTSRDRGREFLDVNTIRRILVLRERGEPASRIESQLNLKPGVVARLGQKGLVSPATL